MRAWLAAVHPAWQEVDVSAPDVMERAATCMDAAVTAALEDAQAHGFPAQLMPSGVPRKTCGLLGHLLANPLCCA